MEHHKPESNSPNSPGPTEIDQFQLQMQMQQAKDNENLALGIMGGMAAALVGAVAWALVTVVTGWQFGIMAIGIGFVVGFVIRKLGQGVSTGFGIAGAVLSLVGCLLGNLFIVCDIVSQQQGIPFFDLLFSLDVESAAELFMATFDPMDLLFYGLAVYYGYKNSFHQTIAVEKSATTTPNQSGK